MRIHTLRFVIRIALVCMLLSILVSCTPTPTPFSSPLPEQSPIAEPQTQEPAQQEPATLPTPTVEAAAPLMPEQGKAALSGTLYSLNFQRVIPQTAFYLVPATADKQPPIMLTGPHQAQGDVLGFSDDQGRFSLNNVPPGDYFMVVWAPLNWILAVTSSVDDTPRLFSLAPDESKVLGKVHFPWP